MGYWARTALQGVTLVAWALMVADAVLPDQWWSLSAADGRLAMVTAGVGAVGWMLRASARPVDEVFDSGRRFERARIEAEKESCKVVSISRRWVLQR